MRRLPLFLLLGFMMGMAPMAGSAAEQQPMVVIEVQSIPAVRNDYANLLKGMGLPGNPAKMTGPLEAMLPGLSMRDTNLPMRVYVFLRKPEDGATDRPSMDSPFSVVAAAPMKSNASRYIDDVLGRRYRKGKTINDVVHFKAPADNDDDPGQQTDFYAKAIGNTAVVGSNGEMVEEVCTNHLKADPETFLLGTRGTIRVAVRMDVCKPWIKQWMDMMADLTALQEAFQKNHPAGQPRASVMLRAQGKLLSDLLNGVDTFSMGLSTDSKEMEITSAITFKTDSLYAQAMREAPKPATRYVSAIPLDSPLAVVGNEMGMIDALLGPYGEYLTTVYKAMGQEEAAKATTDMMKAFTGAYSGEYAVGVVRLPAGKGVGLVEVFALREPEKIKKITLDMLENYSQIADPMQSGVVIVPDAARKYKGASVHTFHYRFDFKALAEQQRAQGGSAVGFEGNPILELFQNMEFHVAFTGKDMMYVLGPDELVNLTIDRMQGDNKGLDQSPILKQLCPEMKNPDKFGHASTVQVLKAMLMCLPSTDPNTLQILSEEGDGMAGYEFRDGEVRRGVFRMRFNEIGILIRDWRMIAATFATSMMPGTKLPPADPAATCRMNLRTLQAVKDMAAVDMDIKEGEPIPPDKLLPYLRGKMPICPSGGTYTIGPYGTDPTCSHKGHTLRGRTK